jgi:hypothetical protein
MAQLMASRSSQHIWISRIALLSIHPGIGAKMGGTREQCSQKLFELAEIFRKIIKIMKNYKHILCIMKKGS